LRSGVLGAGGGEASKDFFLQFVKNFGQMNTHETTIYSRGSSIVNPRNIEFPGYENNISVFSLEPIEG